MLVQNVIQVLADARPCFQSNSDIQKDNVNSKLAKLSVSPTPVTPSGVVNNIVDKNSSISGSSLFTCSIFMIAFLAASFLANAAALPLKQHQRYPLLGRSFQG